MKSGRCRTFPKGARVNAFQITRRSICYLKSFSKPLPLSRHARDHPSRLEMIRMCSLASNARFFWRKPYSLATAYGHRLPLLEPERVNL